MNCLVSIKDTYSTTHRVVHFGLNWSETTASTSSHTAFVAVDFLIENSISPTLSLENSLFFKNFQLCKQRNLPATSISIGVITIVQARYFSSHNQQHWNVQLFAFQKLYNCYNLKEYIQINSYRGPCDRSVKAIETIKAKQWYVCTSGRWKIQLALSNNYRENRDRYTVERYSAIPVDLS